MGRQARLRSARRHAPLPPPSLLDSLRLLLVMITGTERQVPAGRLHRDERREARRKREFITNALIFGSGAE